MSLKIAAFMTLLATDASAIQQFNAGNGEELAKNREALMTQFGLSADEKAVVHEYDSQRVDDALRIELSKRFGFRAEVQNATIRLVPLAGMDGLSNKLARFFHELATDADVLKLFNTGESRTELAKNRELLMQAAGLSEDEKNVVRGHDNDAVDGLLRRELGVRLDSWSNTGNSSINISTIG